LSSSLLLKRTRFAVRILPSNEVELTFGDSGVIMDYHTANRVAVMLRGQARKAKKQSGDVGTHVIGFADLTDATLDELKAQRSRDATAVFGKVGG
jgi:hypothetical protein